MKHSLLQRFLILAISLTLLTQGYAQPKLTLPDTLPPAPRDSVEGFSCSILNLHTVVTGFRDGGKVYTSPIHWGGSDWIKLAVVGGAGIALHQLDDPINRMIERNNTSLMKGFSSTFEPFGNAFYVVPALGGTYLFARLKKNDDLSGFAITAGKAVIITNAICTWTKVLAHRHRPNDDTPSLPNRWDGPRADLKDVSFFSSHTATAFSLATVVASTYSDHKWVPPVAYTMASLVGISRITGRDHWATDVFVGAVVGYTVGKLVYKLNRSKRIQLVVGL